MIVLKKASVSRMQVMAKARKMGVLKTTFVDFERCVGRLGALVETVKVPGIAEDGITLNNVHSILNHGINFLIKSTSIDDYIKASSRAVRADKIHNFAWRQVKRNAIQRGISLVRRFTKFCSSERTPYSNPLTL